MKHFFIGLFLFVFIAALLILGITLLHVEDAPAAPWSPPTIQASPLPPPLPAR